MTSLKQRTTTSTAPRRERPTNNRSFGLDADDIVRRPAEAVGRSRYARDAEARLLTRWRRV